MTDISNENEKGVIEVYQGDTLTITREVVDGSKIKDLSNFTVKFWIKEDLRDDPIFEKEGEVLNPHKGLLQIEMTSEETASLDDGGYYYTILIDSENETKTVSRNNFLIRLR